MKVAILIAGGGLGGVAAALAATDAGHRVVLTEETDWLGGQLTSQAVPPDEHPWIEQFGRTRRYASLRERIRDYYRRNFPLTAAARVNPVLNPGNGTVSKLCHLPKVAAMVCEEMLAPAQAAGLLEIRRNAVPVAAESDAERIRSVRFLDTLSGGEFEVCADFVLDATETGDLLPLAGVDYVSGAESRSETGELHALEGAAQPGNVQSITWCFPLAYDPDCREARDEYQIEKPGDYAFWRDYTPKLTPAWSGKLFSLEYSAPQTRQPKESPLFPGDGRWALWTYRRIHAAELFSTPQFDISLINWPQNDYMEGSLIDRPEAGKQAVLHGAKQLSLSFAWWLQNEVPRPDGGSGYPGLHLRPDVTETADGLAKAPYIRESRRIRALRTVTECDIGVEAREGRWPEAFADSVGVGSYRMDLHPSANGVNYVDIGAFPFQIPMGALIPQSSKNLLAAAKNIGSTHISNGCYRLHPVEWNIGEAAGSLAAFCLSRKRQPREVWEQSPLSGDYQEFLVSQGIQLEWPAIHAR